MPRNNAKYAIAAVLLVISALLLLAPSPSVDNSATEWIDENDHAYLAYADFQRRFGSDEVIVVQVESADSAALLRSIETFTDILSQDGAIERVVSAKTVWGPAWRSLTERTDAPPPSVSSPLNDAFELLSPALTSGRVLGLSRLRKSAELVPLSEALSEARAREAEAGVTVRIAGNPLINLALDTAGEDVEQRSMPILVIMSLAVLFLLTRHLPTALAALVPAGLTVQAAEGALGLLGVETNIVVNIAKPLLFVLLLAGTLHVVVGWQDALEGGASRKLAPWIGARAKGRAVWMALLTTAVGFGSLYLSDVPPIRRFGLLSAAGLLAGIPQLLVLLPVILRWVPPGPSRGDRLGGLAEGLCRFGERRALLLPAAALLVIVAGMTAASTLTSDPHAIRYFGEDHLLRTDHEALEAEGLGLAAAELIIEGKETQLSPDALDRMRALHQDLLSLTGVRQVMDAGLLLREAAFRSADLAEPDSDRGAATAGAEAPADFMADDGRTARVSLLIGTLDADALETLRGDIRRRFERHYAGTGAELTITGNYGILLSTQAGLLDTLQQSLLVTGLLVTGLFLLFLGSVKLCLLSLIPNLLPVSAIFLAMAVLDLPLDVGTSMTAAIALGIAVDDTLHFVLSWQATRRIDVTARSTGRAIILSSAVIGVGFLALMSSDFTPTRNFGLLSAAAMAAALAADLLVLPPLLRLGLSTKANGELQAAASKEAA